MNSIHFFFKGVSPSLRDRTRLKDFIAAMFKQERKGLGTLNYVFCTDEELLKINQLYLDHDFYTDILSFDLGTSSKEIQGEIYISSERVRENAEFYGSTFLGEFHRVIFHGALHLCGYNDKTAAQKRIMRAKEDYYLSKYFGHVPRNTVSP